MSSPRASRAFLLLCAASGLWAAPPAARAQSESSIEEVADCAIRNLPPSAHAHAKLAVRAGGAEKTIDVEYWSHTGSEGTRKIEVVQRGGPESGPTGYLVSDGNAVGEAWAVAKGEPKAKRIEAPKERLFGSNVTLEDFARFGRVVFPGQVRRLPDAEVGGRKAYVIETRPSPDSKSAYSRIVTSIDREWCLILRRESYDAAFEKGEKPRKLYEASPTDVKVQDKFANATRARLSDANDGSTTELQVTALEVPDQVDESFFTPAALERTAH
jgi:outer membrane lipoprotein-sorting protein